MTINERFDKIINDFFQGNKSAFAKAIGVSPTVIENIVGTRKGNPSFEVVQKVLYANENISPDWLIIERGKMLVSDQSYAIAQSELLLLNESHEKKHAHQLIPIYNIEAAAGLVSLFNNPNGFIPIDYISLPNVGKVDGGLYAFGDSMYPLIKSGDIVVFRRLIDMFDSIFYGEMYLISYDLEGEEYIVIKYIQKSDKPDHIKLVSQNQHHSPKDIPMRKVNALALIKASVRFNTIRPNN